MLDVGWTEILVIAVVLIIVVGPKDLPQMLRTFGRMMSKMRGMAGDFRQQFDAALREADLEDVKKTIGEAQKLNPLNTIREAVNPLRQMGEDIKADLRGTTGAVSTPAVNPAESVSTVPFETGKPASGEPVATVPLKAGPVKKLATKKTADGAARPVKPRKADGEVKPVAKPAEKKAVPARARTVKTKKGNA